MLLCLIVSHLFGINLSVSDENSMPSDDPMHWGSIFISNTFCTKEPLRYMGGGGAEGV